MELRGFGVELRGVLNWGFSVWKWGILEAKKSGSFVWNWCVELSGGCGTEENLYGMSSYLMLELFLSGTKSLDLLHENPAAHNAGITCMCLIVDQEFNAMLLTGIKKQDFD